MPLIVIDGLDGSGKATQTALLCQKLNDMGHTSRALSFPDYAQPSSALVQMYLRGDFGDHPEAVNAYAAGSFFACDRYASFVLLWKSGYDAGEILIADRYSTSNAIHQMGKLPRAQWPDYVAWIEHYEYELLGLPRPDIVIYLDVPLETSQRLLSSRYGGDEGKKDIHEKAQSYLRGCKECADYALKEMGWQVVHCQKEGVMRTVDDINLEILKIIKDSGLIHD